MQALKSFMDGQGRRLRPGDTLPGDYDPETLVHYRRYGMVGEQVDPAKPAKAAKPARPARMPAPEETKPTAPDESKAADDSQAATPPILDI